MTNEKTTLNLFGPQIWGIETERRSVNTAYPGPEIVAVVDALAAIQGSKYDSHFMECAGDVYRCSPGAYEADE